MLQGSVVPALDSTPRARLERLAGEVLVATWDEGEESAGGAIRPLIDGVLAPRPCLVVSVPRRDGRTRRAVLLHWPRSTGNLFTAEASGKVVAAAERSMGEALPPLDGRALLSGLDPAARCRLLRALLGYLAGWAGRVGGHAVAAAGASALIEGLWPRRGSLRQVARATDRHSLFVGSRSLPLGALSEIFLVSPRFLRLERGAGALANEGESKEPRARAILPDPGAAAEIVLIGSAGLATFRLKRAAKRLPSLAAWAAAGKRNAAARARDVIPLLRALAADDPRAAAALREVQLLVPTTGVRNRADGPALRVMLDAVVADGDGLVAAGWMDGPHGTIEGLALDGGDGSTRIFDGAFHRYPRRIRTEHDEGETERTVVGFISRLADAPQAQHVLTHRLHAMLGSGTTIPLPPARQPGDPAAARTSLLASIRPEAVTPEIMEECLAPAIARLHRRCLEVERTPDEVAFGPAPSRPAFSVVVPLYRNLEFLRFQIAAFAVDPDRRRSEFIYVLDSPEQRLEVEHLLRGLCRLHDLPIRLLVNRANLGYAATNNVAAGRARGEIFALVNSDVLPITPGWMSTLAARLSAEDGLGAVGPKLLFEDQSLQHAGMYFAKDLTGRWLNHHYYKGLPRFFPPAQKERSVPALTGACLAVRRDDFLAVGGFTEDYVIGDYEDSDLCLKLRQRGYDLRYVPSAELYHLERRSIRHHAGYMKGVACLYNAWLHAKRWRDEMAALSGTGETPPEPASRRPAHRVERVAAE